MAHILLPHFLLPLIQHDCASPQRDERLALRQKLCEFRNPSWTEAVFVEAAARKHGKGEESRLKERPLCQCLMSHTCLNRQEPGQATLLLAYLREDRLGSSLIAAMSAFSPSMFPSSQM